MPTAMNRVLLRGGAIVSPADPGATAMLTVGNVVTWVGDESGATGLRDSADHVVQLDARLVTPGFVDAHVHLAKTGFAAQSVDLSHATSLVHALDLLAGYAGSHPSDALLFAHGWDETTWPEARPFSGDELDRAVGARVAYVSRVDAHSAVVSSALVAKDPQVRTSDGWRGNGVVERDSHHLARAVVDSLTSDADRERALLVALHGAARAGITSVHEANAPHIAPYSDAAVVGGLRAEHTLPEVVAYWGALLGGDNAEADGLAGFAGDLCVDGALGSRTAALTSPYSDAATPGHLYLDDRQIRDHVVWCTERGVQAGFHVIGDRAMDAVASGLRMASEKVGADRLVGARHRLEHVEMCSPEAIATLAALGVVASVQPAFDAAWGGPGELYEQRLGVTRAAPMNPFASMRRAGVTLAFGSDSPVTPLDPWGAIRAAVWHHNRDERLSMRAAFAAHTQGGHRARHVDAGGVLAPGADASYAVWDIDTAGDPGVLPEMAVDSPSPRCVRTVVSGGLSFDAEEAS